MGPIAARYARTVLEHVERIVAIELLVAAQAIDLRLEVLTEEGASDGTNPGLGVMEGHDRVRAVATRVASDREPGPDLAAATRLVHDGLLVDLVAGAGTTAAALPGWRPAPR